MTPHQTEQTQRLGKRIRCIREKIDRDGKKTKWRIVCTEVHPPILFADGTPDTGLAYQIAYDDKEPEDRALRKRLGLSDICVTCHRRFVKRSVTKKVKRSPARVWFMGLKSERKESLIEFLFDTFGDLE